MQTTHQTFISHYRDDDLPDQIKGQGSKEKPFIVWTKSDHIVRLMQLCDSRAEATKVWKKLKDN